MRSAFYDGTVVHERTGQGGLGPRHRFRFPLTMLLLDLDEIDEVSALHPLWRHGGGWAPVRLQRADLPGDRARPPAEALRSLAEAPLGRAAPGPIQVLFHPRTWGWLFNPIACAYLHDDEGEPIGMVAEVTNTPWHERHHYVLGPPGTHMVPKAMHVSPFLPPTSWYRVTWQPPGERLRLAWDLLLDDPRTGEPGGDALRTRLVLERQPLDRTTMGRLLWRRPFQTHRVSAGIYRQALHLARRGAPFHPHPDPRRRWRLPGRSRQAGAIGPPQHPGAPR
ncbi:DUF1365 domain-containing protein [Aciditerrimonas ferrireducens]|uniref:DUF1365 domain-containing protein n=1 Tax=Aciditerrimonas ferrireducens TaxID=667306 RepID=A0ABV6C2M6_9ACTN